MRWGEPIRDLNYGKKALLTQMEAVARAQQDWFQSSSQILTYVNGHCSRVI